jgi:hypothetical protein
MGGRMSRGCVFETRPAEGYLHFAISGDFPQDPKEQSFFHKECAALVESAGHALILVDIRGIARRPDVPGMFEFVVRNYPLEPKPLRIAVLDLPEHLGKTYFFETLMQNRGLDYRLFKDKALALAWLLAGQAQTAPSGLPSAPAPASKPGG